MEITDELLSGIDQLLTQVKEMEDPAELNEFHRLSRRSVPMGMRKHVQAFLFREYFKTLKTPHIPKLKDEVSLFMGVGKNRRVFPKDIIHLFINTGKVERNQIGEIKILDNYSFVSVSKDAADRIIDNLNGINYRGRSLNINYAKKK